MKNLVTFLLLAVIAVNSGYGQTTARPTRGGLPTRPGSTTRRAVTLPVRQQVRTLRNLSLKFSNDLLLRPQLVPL